MLKSCRTLVMIIIASSFIITIGCNRAAVRLHGVSSFPSTPGAYQAHNNYLVHINVLIPNDLRDKYYGSKIAGTNWQACRTDAFYGDEAKHVVRERTMQELRLSNLFNDVSGDDLNHGTENLLLSMDIRAFCSEVKGFLIARAAGIVSIEFTLTRGKEVLFSKTIEKVVTDADPEYSGSQVAVIEQAMLHLMADSLRVVHKELLKDMELTLKEKI